MDMRTKEAIAYIVLSLSFIILGLGIYVNIAGISEAEFKAITGKVSGDIRICIDQDIKFTNRTLDIMAVIETAFSLDVNVTSESSFSNLNFTDNSSMFNINQATGLIEFTPAADQNGTYYIQLTVGNDLCMEPDDEIILNLTILTPNLAPTLSLAPRYILTEDMAFVYNFSENASDPNNDVLKFYDNSPLFVIGESSGMVAFTPTNDQVGNHSIRFYVVDTGFPPKSDYNDTIFEIQNVNDAPMLNPIGAKTAYINQTFTLTLIGIDIDQNAQLAFSSNYSWFLNSSGYIPTAGYISTYLLTLNFTNYSQWNGTYSVNITVNDTEGAQDSEVISFTITTYNYPPNITSYYPPNKTLELSYSGTQLFNITKEDPDGTIPSTMWFIDDVFINVTADEYTFSAASRPEGDYNVTVTITDGLLNDSESWTVTVLPPPPPPPTQAGSGPGSGPSSFGGSRGRYVCEPLWVCTDWGACSKASIQTRECKDFYDCGTMDGQPTTRQGCTYVDVPSCFDGIKNQDEVLPDCGGVCAPCPTCDDGIQNQDEEGVDCGGPCPVCTEERLPSFPSLGPSYPAWGLWLMMTLLMLTGLRLGKGLLSKKKGFWKHLRFIPSSISVLRVNYLLKKAEWQMARKNYQKARRTYSKARELYSKLPSEKQVKVRH
ncbi:MAG: hypothetical protein ABIB71_04950 [Candidatus Woesearchaeota archaeon]